MTIQIIGVSGYARAGKDTIGQALVNRGWTRISLANTMYKALYELNPLVSGSKRLVEAVDEYGWEIAKTAFPEIRKLLQRLGAEVGRDLMGEDTWINLAFKDLPDGSKIVVTDCRFPNEAEKIQSLGGKMWRVERPGRVAMNAHKSEVALDDYPFDCVFQNDGSIMDLDAKVGAQLHQMSLLKHDSDESIN